MADLVRFVHNGCFTARFIATWNEMRIDEDGIEQPTIKSYYSGSVENNYSYTVTSSSDKINNLCVSIESCTGLTWDMWKRIADAQNIPTDQCVTFTTSGTVLNPKVKIEPPIEHVSRYIL